MQNVKVTCACLLGRPCAYMLMLSQLKSYFMLFECTVHIAGDIWKCSMWSQCWPCYNVSKTQGQKFCKPTEMFWILLINVTPETQHLGMCLQHVFTQIPRHWNWNGKWAQSTPLVLQVSALLPLINNLNESNHQ